jgi:superfamily II DNA/RNA helicase
MSINFKDLGLSEPILKALDEMGFEEPTEVQEQAIPSILNGEDVIVMSKTGSGKTAVFGVSMLQLTDPTGEGPQCLILEPTRELAVQVDNDLRKMAKHLRHRTTAVYGQHSMNVEIQALKDHINIVAGTPGRVYDHIDHGNLVTKNIRFLVLDEVDRMMDMGFIDQVRRIVRTLPRNRTTLLFSATIPEEIRRLCSEYMKNPVTIEMEYKTMTVDTVEQTYYRVERNEKRTQLNRLLLSERPETCMIFCNTRIAVDHVQSFLSRKGYACRSLHGDIPQAKRLKNIQQFKRGEYNILVATDVAARGIHIDDLSLVINYDVPVELDSYVHRIGRTGRAGHNGRAVSLVTSDDIITLYAIEEHIGTMIPQADLPTDQELAECKEEAEKWIQANAEKTPPARPASETGAREGQKKPYSKRPGQQRSGQQRSNQDKPDGQRAVLKNAEGQANGQKRLDQQTSGQPKSGQQRTDQQKQDGQHPNQQRSGQQRSGQQQDRNAQRPGDRNRPQYSNYDRNRQSNADNRTGQTNRPQPNQTNRPYTDRAANAQQEQARSFRSYTDSAAPQAAPADIKKQPQETTAKPSLFKRIIGKIFGK